MGGASSEAEVSRSSAAEVATALRALGHEVTCHELDADLIAKLVAHAPQIAFPVLHGPPGEDGTLQGALELLRLPYVGSGVGASATAMDKALSKLVYRHADLPIAEDFRLDFSAPDSVEDATIAGQITQALGQRVVVKPNAQGSAIGVERTRSAGELLAALTAAAESGASVLVEPFIDGREITVGVLDEYQQSSVTFPVTEVRCADGQWYDYENRYAAGQSEHVIPAQLPESMLTELQSIALRAHRALGLTDLSRSDFLVTAENEIYLLETNSMPGMTPTSLYPDGARAAGIEFEALMQRLVVSGLQRGRRLRLA